MLTSPIKLFSLIEYMDALMDIGRHWGPATFIIAFIQGPTVLKPVVLSGIITGILKVLSGRLRPDAKKQEASEFALFRGQYSDSYQSFPSGHATVAFAFAAASTGKPELKLVFYILAGLTAVSRVYHQRHWTSDVIGGSIIGYSIGRYF